MTGMFRFKVGMTREAFEEGHKGRQARGAAEVKPWACSGPSLSEHSRGTCSLGTPEARVPWGTQSFLSLKYFKSQANAISIPNSLKDSFFFFATPLILQEPPVSMAAGSLSTFQRDERLHISSPHQKEGQGCLVLLFSCSVTSDSLWPHGLQHTRLLCTLLSPGVCSSSSSCPLSLSCYTLCIPGAQHSAWHNIQDQYRVLSKLSLSTEK